MPFVKGHPFYKGGEKGQFKKGRIPWNKGLKIKGHKQTIETRKKISKAKLELYKDKTKHPYEYAKLPDKKYKLDRNNFIMLCRQCHTKLDKKSKNFKLQISS